MIMASFTAPFRFSISFSICNFSWEGLDSTLLFSLISVKIVAVDLARRKNLKMQSR